MAKRKKNQKRHLIKGFRSVKKLFHLVLSFYIPKEITSKLGWAWFGSSRIAMPILTSLLSIILLFSTVPVPYSAYMIQQKISHLIEGKPYNIKKKWVSLENISWQMQMAVIASEDQKFESHFGIDLNAIQIALEKNAKSKTIRGASTISQQTIKNMFLWHGQSWLRKGIELPLTFVIEQFWGKTRILEVYLNVAEFGNGIFGVEAASQAFFKKSAKNLTISEAALLAASLPNPNIYRVDRPNTTMKKRQAWIIKQVSALGGQKYLNKLD